MFLTWHFGNIVLWCLRLISFVYIFLHTFTCHTLVHWILKKKKKRKFRIFALKINLFKNKYIITIKNKRLIRNGLYIEKLWKKKIRNRGQKQCSHHPDSKKKTVKFSLLLSAQCMTSKLATSAFPRRTFVTWEGYILRGEKLRLSVDDVLSIWRILHSEVQSTTVPDYSPEELLRAGIWCLLGTWVIQSESTSRPSANSHKWAPAHYRATNSIGNSWFVSWGESNLPLWS